jgi:DNA-binding XRE family transcriptional regulator
MVDDDPASRAVRKGFADAFRRARLDAGLTQLQAAVKADVTPNHLSAIENGRHDPKLSTAARMAESVGKVLEVRLVDPPQPSRKRKI